jgi:hypothetical protein
VSYVFLAKDSRGLEREWLIIKHLEGEGGTAKECREKFSRMEGKETEERDEKLSAFLDICIYIYSRYLLAVP